MPKLFNNCMLYFWIPLFPALWWSRCYFFLLFLFLNELQLLYNLLMQIRSMPITTASALKHDIFLKLKWNILNFALIDKLFHLSWKGMSYNRSTLEKVAFQIKVPWYFSDFFKVRTSVNYFWKHFLVMEWTYFCSLI